MLARGDPSRDTQGSRLAGSYAGSVSSLALKTPSCSSPGRELIADVQRLSTDEADSRSCFSLDGEGLELARDMRTYALGTHWTRRTPRPAPTFGRASNGQGETDPPVVANQILYNHWALAVSDAALLHRLM